MVDVLVLKSLLLCVGTLSLELLCCVQLNWRHKSLRLCYVPHSSASSFRRFSSSKWWCETSHSAFWVLFVVRASQLSAQWEVWMTDRSQWNVSGPLNKTDTKKTTKNQNIFLDYTTNSNWHSNPWHLLVGLGNWYLLLLLLEENSFQNFKIIVTVTTQVWHVETLCTRECHLFSWYLESSFSK